MAANTIPITPLTPNVKSTAIGGAANTDATGVSTIGTNSFIVFQAGTAGSFVDRVRLQPVASVAATATTATTIRIFVSTLNSGTTAATNTSLIAEVSAASQTADHSTSGTFFIDVPIGFPLAANQTLLATNHVINAANTGWAATGIGGDY